MTDQMRNAFEAYCKSQNPAYRSTDDGVLNRRDLVVWQAATLAERDRCERLCTAQPVQLASWDEAQRVCDLPEVDEAIQNLIEDNTGDNATSLVLEVMNSARPVQPPQEFEAVYAAALKASKPGTIKDIARLCCETKVAQPVQQSAAHHPTAAMQEAGGAVLLDYVGDNEAESAKRVGWLNAARVWIAMSKAQPVQPADALFKTKVIDAITSLANKQGVDPAELFDWLCADGLEAITEHWHSSPSRSPVVCPECSHEYEGLGFPVGYFTAPKDGELQ